MLLFAEQIRAARAILRMDQADLARRANVSVETIKRLEKMEGEVRANYETVESIVLALEGAGIELISPGQSSSDGGGGLRVVADIAVMNVAQVHDLFERTMTGMIYETYRDKPEAFGKAPADMIDVVLETIVSNRDRLVEILDRRLGKRDRPVNEAE
jgi:transcriptional regulator with XRE-family HTH domain